jgi:hypothetical protein
MVFYFIFHYFEFFSLMEQHRYGITETRIENVTVYLDRAEVNRVLTLQLQTLGEHEILLTGMTICAVFIKMHQERSDFLF